MDKPKPGTPLNPFVYDADDNTLQWFLCLGAAVAGKTATVQEHKLRVFFTQCRAAHASDPGDAVGPVKLMLGLSEAQIRKCMKQAMLGQYNRLSKCYMHIAAEVHAGRLDLRKCSADDLEKIPGIGRKTARFFILFTRRDADCACLDTHVVQFMRFHGMIPRSQTHTQPRNAKEYAKWEKIFVNYCREQGRPIAEVDFEIWERGSEQRRRKS